MYRGAPRCVRELPARGRRLDGRAHGVVSTAAADHTTHPARSSDHGPALELGAMVGRFVVLGLIGRGGLSGRALVAAPRASAMVCARESGGIPTRTCWRGAC